MTSSIGYRKRGQAVWLDSISSRMIHSGRLANLINEGSVYGVTSNPTIFGQAIEKNEGDYNARISELTGDGSDGFEIYDDLTRRDVAEAADQFRTLHAARAEDGWVSLEVLPELAFDAEKTVREALRLNRLLDRPNVFIKVPATPAGVVAVRRLIGAGVSVNVTLMFNRKHYRDVANAYIDGVADLVAQGGDPRRVASVASFFVSRVDTFVDRLLEDQMTGAAPAERGKLDSLRGKAALANSKVVYQDFREVFGTPRWKELEAKGASLQRPLWASTGTKNPSYSDLLYVENLVGPDTVNTMPEKTLEALLDHGRDLGDTVLEGVDAARQVVADLAGLWIDLETVGEKLQGDGVVLFSKSYDELLKTIEERRMTALYESAKTQKIRTL